MALRWICLTLAQASLASRLREARPILVEVATVSEEWSRGGEAMFAASAARVDVQRALLHNNMQATTCSRYSNAQTGFSFDLKAQILCRRPVPEACFQPLSWLLQLQIHAYVLLPLHNLPGVAGRDVFGVVAAEEASEGDCTCRHASISLSLPSNASNSALKYLRKLALLGTKWPDHMKAVPLAKGPPTDPKQLLTTVVQFDLWVFKLVH